MTDSPEQTPHTERSEPEPVEPDVIEVERPKVPLEGPPPEVPPSGRTMANVARQFRTIT
jgi:hypothetical protein